MSTRQLILFIVTVLLTIVSGCSFYSAPERTVETLSEDGWSLFQRGKYDAALDKFIDATYKDNTSEMGYHGKAWCYLMLNEVINAVENFNLAILKGNRTLDPKAGLAAAYLAVGSYPEAIQNAQAVLSGNSHWFFEYEPLINFQDMRLISAMAYFHEGQLATALEQVTYLYPGHNLNPEDPSSWRVNSRLYASFAEALMALIDYLDVQFGM